MYLKEKVGKSIKIDFYVYNHVIEIGKQLLAESDVEKVLTLAIDRAIEISGAERGIVILFNENDETLFETARNLDKINIANPKFEVSCTIIDPVRKEDESICHRNTFENLLRIPHFEIVPADQD